MNDTQLNVLRIDSFDTATVATESGAPLLLLRFHAAMDSSPWIALDQRQHDELIDELRTRQRAALEHDYNR